MAKMTLVELKREISEMLAEARKKKAKAEKAKRNAGQAAASYGTYDEAFDFSEPLGEFNLLRSQGGVNWGPQTSSGTRTEIKESEEQALRSLIREVLDSNFVPQDSVWTSLSEATDPSYGSIWEAAAHFWEKTEDLKKKNKSVGSAACHDKKKKRG